MIVECQVCGTKNRVPDEPFSIGRYRCGNPNCGEILAGWVRSVPGSMVRDRPQPEPSCRDGEPVMTNQALIPGVASVILLLLAVFGRWPYGFYTFLRIVVCGSAIYIAFQASVIKSFPWVWLMGAVAVVFNPLIPLRLPRPTWQAIDFIAAVVFVVSLLALRVKQN